MTPSALHTETLRPRQTPLDRSLLARIFGLPDRMAGRMTGHRGETAGDGHDLWPSTAFARDEASAVALAQGDRRKVGRGSPYPANGDIEALYARARAAGGAIALDLCDDREASSGRRHRVEAAPVEKSPAGLSNR